MVIAYTSLQFSFDAKPENRSAAETESGRYLFNRQPSSIKQSFITDPRVVDGILRHLKSPRSKAQDPFEPRAPPTAAADFLQ